MNQVHKYKTLVQRETKITVGNVPWGRDIEIYWDLEKLAAIRVESDGGSVRIIIEEA